VTKHSFVRSKLVSWQVKREDTCFTCDPK